jgi:hypothetical protein
MTAFDHIFDRFVPHHSPHARFELGDRREQKRRRLGLLAALFILAQREAGQAGIGNINQVQVSKESRINYLNDLGVYCR